MPHLTSRALFAALIGGLLATAALTGCGGGNSGTGGTSGTGGSLTLAEIRAMTAQGLDDQLPAGHVALATIDSQTGTPDEETMLANENALTRAPGATSWDYQHLHFEETIGLVNGIQYTRTTRVTGTAADGATVDITRTLVINLALPTRTLTVTGTITAGGDVHHIDISRVRNVSGGVATLTANADLTRNGSVLYAKRITRTIDTNAAQPYPRTISGTITVHDPADIGKSVLLTCNTLQYSWDTANLYRVYTGGSLDLLTAFGDHAHLTVTADGDLTGTLHDVSNTVRCTVTIGHGQVTFSGI